MRVTFGEFELDDELFELRRAGAVVPLGPRPFDLLAYLVRKRDVVVPKAELLHQVWQGAVVTEDSLPQAVRALRQALGDDDEKPRFIATVRGRGYRFVAKVDEIDGPRNTPVDPGPVGPAPRETDLVGRAAELAELTARLDARRAGGGITLVTGAPGAGKTRLVEEALRAARVPVAWARAQPSPGAPPLWPMLDAARQIAGSEPLPKPIAEALDVAMTGEAPGSVRLALDAALAEHFARTALTSPFALVVDDAESIDPANLDVAELVGREVERAPIALVIVYRQTGGGDGSAAARVAGKLARSPRARVFSLGELSRDEVAAFASRTLGREAPAEIVDKVYQKTGGNPLLLTQIGHVLRAEARLRADAVGTSTLIGGDEMRAAIASQLAALTERARAVLGAGAALGNVFRSSPIAAALGMTPTDVLEALDEVLPSKLVARAGVGEYRFSYPLVRDILDKSMPAAEAARLHGRLGRALADAVTDGASHAELGEVARHFALAAAAGDGALAAEWAAKAAEAALAAGEHAAASEHAARGEEALRHGAKVPPALRTRLARLAARARGG